MAAVARVAAAAAAAAMSRAGAGGQARPSGPRAFRIKPFSHKLQMDPQYPGARAGEWGQSRRARLAGGRVAPSMQTRVRAKDRAGARAVAMARALR